MTQDVDAQVLVSVLAAVAIAAIVFRRWLWGLCRLAGRTAVGGAALALLAQFSGLTGLSLGVNLVNALVIGVLGLPGFGLLCALQWLTG